MPRYAVFYGYIGTYLRSSARSVSKIQLPVDFTSVQGIFEEALKIFRPAEREWETAFYLSSRTDQGVHAISTAGHFDLTHPEKDKVYRPIVIKTALNHFFKKSLRPIRVHRALIVHDEFSSRHDALSRTYMYRFGVVKSANPRGIRLPLMEMQRSYLFAASSFKIEEAIKVADLFHDRLDDWTTFTPKQADKDIRKRGAQRTVRKIIKCTLEPSPVFAPTPEESEEWSKHIDMYTVTIQSRSFLYNQVRRMVGCIIAAGCGKITVAEVESMFWNPSPFSWKSAVQVLPVDGLYLKSVEYSPEDVPPFTAEEETSELEGFDEQEIELWRRPLVSPLSQELSQTMDAAEEEELYPKDLMKRSADSEPPKFNILSILRILGKRRKRRSFPLSVSRESSGCVSVSSSDLVSEIGTSKQSSLPLSQMTRYAVVFSYIGTYLRGVQKMVSDPVDMDSVQGIFEEALKNFQSKLPHSFNASSRTDQGVHAMYTVGHFDLLHPIDGKQYYAPFLMRFLNHYMEKNQRSLRIHRIVPVDEDFHARFSAKGRSYLYRFGVLHRPNDLGMISPMLEVGKCYIVNAPFDEDKAREICSLFHGRQGHWTMFKKPHQNKGNRGQMALVDGRVRTNRTVDSCTLEKAGPPMSLDGSWTDAMEMFNIKITARSFLYQQVRRMVGCILEAGTGRTTEEEVRGLLASTTFAPWPNHIQVAPADGLYLTNVEYDTLDLPEYDPKEDDLDYESIKKEPTDSATGVRQKG